MARARRSVFGQCMDILLQSRHLSSQQTVQDYSTTSVLLERYKKGDRASCDALFKLYQPLLRRWARGRLPQYTRDLMDTEDLVQDTLMLAFDRAGRIEAKRPGAFFAYLRTVFINQIRQELRKNKPHNQSLESSADPVDNAQDMNALLAYDQALDRLSVEEKEAVVLRLEFGFTHQEIAVLTDKPSANAARMFITRAIMKLADCMT